MSLCELDCVDYREISLKVSRELQAMRDKREPPKLRFALKWLHGAGVSAHNIAELVHNVSFPRTNKPHWVSVQPSGRAVLQTVVIRIQCHINTVMEVGEPGSYIDEFFGRNFFLQMRPDVQDTEMFWSNLLNIAVSNAERTKRIATNGDILKPFIDFDENREMLVTLRQMTDNGYPFPGKRTGYPNNLSLPPIIPTKKMYGIASADSPFFAIDCEMCVTAGGNELVRISLVDENLDVLLDTLVKPRNKITDYMTKYSGVTKSMLDNVWVRVEDVQKALSHILPDNAILVGHTIECDLNALRLSHPYCVDISLCLNLSGNERQRSSLKTLAKIFLNEEIQGDDGHCSVDDAMITMRLLKYKLSQGLNF
ncbi:unnamed protein product [Gongylonema pulchrum]|uniref:Exonuclease domain-containing protein n=1 Tax=Gongylonema pulchrum TaxID=637853 RepID=A0A183DVT2_9BILA|nr:unnamed protein product [Gongylonema pulchrum]